MLLLLLLLRELLTGVDPLDVADVATVDRRDDGRRRGAGAAGEAGHFIQEEAADEGDEDNDPDPLRVGPHLLQHGLYPVAES